MADDLTDGLRRCGLSNAQHHESSLTSVTSDTVSVPADWTPTIVESRLRDAFALKVTLSAWPSRPGDGESTPTAGSVGIIGGIGSAASNDGEGSGAIGRAVAALSWLEWLDGDDAGIVLARLAGAPWKAVCWRFGISRATADRRWRYAMALIASRLSGSMRSGSTPSMRALLRMGRAA